MVFYTFGSVSPLPPLDEERILFSLESKRICQTSFGYLKDNVTEVCSLKRCRLGYLKQGKNQNFEEELSKLKISLSLVISRSLRKKNPYIWILGIGDDNQLSGRAFGRNGSNFGSAIRPWERGPVWGIEPPSLNRPHEPGHQQSSSSNLGLIYSKHRL